MLMYRPEYPEKAKNLLEHPETYRKLSNENTQEQTHSPNEKTNEEVYIDESKYKNIYPTAANSKFLPKIHEICILLKTTHGIK